VLGSVLLDPTAITRVLDLLSPDDFYRENNAQIFRAVTELFRQGEPIDNITLADELTRMGVLERVGGRAHLAMLQEGVPTAANIEYYGRIVKAKAQKRRLISAGATVTGLGFDEAVEADDALNEAQRAVYDIADQRVGTKLESLYPLLKDAMERVDAQMARGTGILGVPTGFHDLDRITSGFKNSDLIIVAARPSMGKALALDTPIPTPDGWTTMGALRVGDQVFDESGLPCTVTFATPIQLERECFEVLFSDGERIVADADHQWSVSTRADRKAARRRLANLTTRQMLATLRTKSDQRLNYSIPASGPLQYAPQDLAVDPYVLGVWLGDGHTNTAVVTLGDPEVALELAAVGCPLRPRKVIGTPEYALSDGRGWPQPNAKLTPRAVVDIRVRLAAGERARALAREYSVSPTTVDGIGSGRTWKDPDRPLAVQSQLRALGVLGNKHIPRSYLEAGQAQRLALLQGLMDTDGHIDNLGHAEFVSVRKPLAEGVQELVTGLGLTPRLTVDRAWFNSVDYGPRYRVRFKPTELSIFRLRRKLERQRVTRPHARVRSRFVVDIRPVPTVPVRCIQVDSVNHLYLAGRACIPTHNTSMASGIALHAAVHANVPVAIFSLEMSKEQLVERLLCQQAKIDSQRMHRGMLSDREYEQLVMAIGPLENAPIYIDESPVLDELTLLLKARQARLQHNIGLIVVDYLQLMKGRASKDDNRVQEVSSISRSLKGLARELKIPVIALSQLSRGPEARPNKRPMLSDLRDSGSIEQDSDVVIFLYRDDYYNDKSEEPGICEVIIAKHRNGPTGMVKLRFRKDQTLFYNLESRRGSSDEE